MDTRPNVMRGALRTDLEMTVFKASMRALKISSDSPAPVISRCGAYQLLALLPSLEITHSLVNKSSKISLSLE